MHIEPGLVSPEKIVLSYATATAAIGYLTRLFWQELKERGLLSTTLRSLICAALVFCFFEVLPHHPIGVSEVHLILGSTLFLLFGPAAAGFGLSIGLLIQGLFFAPFDLPQYGMNVTTLLVPLFAMYALAGNVIDKNTAYVDLKYHQALRLSVTYQGGIVLWVGFWALYGQGLSADNIHSILTFGIAYMSVIIVEPLIDVGVLAFAKFAHAFKDTLFVGRRLYNAA
ncbi:energy-coupling factor ABC transporter permease [Vibrio salinus]|uniref:energy-coupling factor ABC transporter permease n=1 Tax=Vibrio salinus TaxID=2899784 RepID=UPI001E3CA395|nr:energy-coupling factor ABC transporter permease [Vibrio salinus]MCE0492950.1 energy-coupling factor ABC transporter permease [Vibrio salinus]